jgi:Fur family transcriptional regulator, ferric uptake regulator
MTQRLTSARRIVLETLEKNAQHMTARQIMDAVKPRLPSLSLSTVCRALDYLCQSGQVSASDMGKGCPVYEHVAEHAHHHLICQRCHGMFPLDEAVVDRFFRHVERAEGFTVITNHLVLFGVCPACRKATC